MAVILVIIDGTHSNNVIAFPPFIDNGFILVSQAGEVSVYNPQNEMFAPRKTKRSLLKNETLLKSPFFKKFSTRLRRGLGLPRLSI